MTRPAIFFDRDNTLIIGNDYLGDPSKVVLVNGAAEAVARARAMGYAAVVVSNQSGVARGMFGEDDVHAVNARMDEMLRAENDEAIIDRHEFCPFHPQAPVERYRLDSDRRKPRPGMLLAVAREMNLDLPGSWLIGDAARDVEAGKSAGCRAILFHDRTLPASPAAETTPRVPPDFVATTLEEAINYIAASESPPVSPSAHPPAPPPPAEVVPGVDHVIPQVIPPATAPANQPTMVPVISPSDPDAPVEASIGTDLARVSHAGTDETPPPQSATEARPSLPRSPEVSSPPPVPVGTDRLEKLADQILQELRRHHEGQHIDFSVSKLLAGIVQVIAVAVMFLAYLNRDSTGLESIMLLGIFLQALTCSLLIMSRQK